MTRPLRAVLYARCSSLKQADLDLSVPAQLDACRLHAQRQGWVADLRAVVERGTVDERRGLLRAWVRRVVADGDDLTIEYTFPLVSVAGAAGGAEGEPESWGGATTRAVNGRGRRKAGGTAPELRKGETASPRFLPTVRGG